MQQKITVNNINNIKLNVKKSYINLIYMGLTFNLKLDACGNKGLTSAEGIQKDKCWKEQESILKIKSGWIILK